MSSIGKGDPADRRYVLEKRCCGHIVGSVEFAVVDECGNVNLVQAGNAGPVAKGSITIDG